MRTYPLPAPIADHELIDLGDPAGLGGEVRGTPRISARVDFQDGGMTAGIFEATTGTVRIHFPFTEHATIQGEVTITDEDGRAHTYRPGDSYLIRQGQVVPWEVAGPRIRKSFFNLAELRIALRRTAAPRWWGPGRSRREPAYHLGRARGYVASPSRRTRSAFW